MSFWDEQMPAGMLLRSPREASHIGDPSGNWSLDRYEASIGVEAVRPVPLDRFVAYGRWVQENAVPDLDRRRVLRLQRGPGGFRLDLEGGDTVTAQRVVLAGGIASVAHVPEVFAGLPADLVSHSSEHRERDRDQEAGQHEQAEPPEDAGVEGEIHDPPSMLGGVGRTAYWPFR
jgi:cation diffusion facilitator CzcD-associated flavoprotein CzcO